MEVDPIHLLTILGMALATYATRAGGLWLMGRVTASPGIEAWLRHIPGAVIISIVAPQALTSGPAEALASLATVLVAAVTRSLILTLVVGVVAVWVLRQLL
jgi:branched chain amino acid efflux pump